VNFKSLFGQPLVAKGGGIVSVTRSIACVDEGTCFLGLLNPTTLASAASMFVIMQIPVGVKIHIKDLILQFPLAYATAMSQLTGTFTLSGEQAPFNLNQATNKASRIKLYTAYSGSPTITPKFGVHSAIATIGKENLLTGEAEKMVVGAGTYLLSLTNAGGSAAAYPYFKARWVEDDA
jgi:hypothetical protein